MNEEIIACIRAVVNVKAIIGELKLDATEDNAKSLYNVFAYLNAIRNSLEGMIQEQKEDDKDAVESES